MSLDDLPPADYKKVERAILAFRKSTGTKLAQDLLYEAMTNAGLSSEYADEYVGMELAELTDA